MPPVQHEDSDAGQNHRNQSKDAAEDVEDHEGCEAGEADPLEGVQTEHPDADEDEAAVDLLEGERVPGVEGEGEQSNKDDNCNVKCYKHPL